MYVLKDFELKSNLQGYILVVEKDKIHIIYIYIVSTNFVPLC